MSRVLLLLLLAAAVAFLIAMRLHNSERARAAREAALPRFGDDPSGESPQGSSSPGTAASDPHAENRRRGLWLLDPSATAKVVKPVMHHPWFDYVARRDATRKAWMSTKLDVHFNHARITDLPDYFASAGLTLRIDPALAVIDHPFVFEFHQKCGDEILMESTSCDPVRRAYGIDGALWLVPWEGSVACEPEFLPELRHWEWGARKILARPEPEGAPEPTVSFSGALPKRCPVEIVRTPLTEALHSLEQTFSVNIFYGSRVDGIDDDPESQELARLPITIVREEVTLEDALKEILDSRNLLAVQSGTHVEILGKEEWTRRIEQSEVEAAESRRDQQAVDSVRGRIVHLDGTTLSAVELANVVASQLGLHTSLDPLLGEMPARWEAVDAEVSLGEVLDAIAAGAKCRCELHHDGWPPRQRSTGGWTLWIVTEGGFWRW